MVVFVVNNSDYLFIEKKKKKMRDLTTWEYLEVERAE
jgi:TPP-dependent 2-oxoacid decarboxylase